jgi:TetR/AcrR family transcriptional repressor of mexJK operon
MVEDDAGPVPGRRRRGRPVDLEKRAAIVQAARALFTREGFEAVSMDAIAAEAGVSKRTVYNHFGDKESLFEAIISEGERLPPLFGEVADVADLRRRLCAVGVALLEEISGPKSHSLGRLLMSEVFRHPELIARFFKAGPQAMHRDLAALLRRATEAGQIATPDPELAADQLLSMWPGQHHLRQQFGLAGPRSREQIVSHVESCVDMFLRAYAAPGSGRGRRR